MPNRLLREGIVSSDHIEALTEAEEVFFYRLLVVCDDYGRTDARPAILKAECFPLKESATFQRIEQWLSGLAAKDLIVRYTHGGKPLLAVNKWEQRVRSRPKYVGPMDDGCTPIDGQPSDNVPTHDGLGLGKGLGKGRGATALLVRKGRTSLPEGWIPKPQTVERMHREFGLRVPEDVDRYVAAFTDICKARDYRYANFDAAFANCVRQDWPKFRGTVIPLSAAERKVAMP